MHYGIQKLPPSGDGGCSCRLPQHCLHHSTFPFVLVYYGCNLAVKYNHGLDSLIKYHTFKK